MFLEGNRIEKTVWFLGRTNQAIVTLNKGQAAQFTFYAPIQKVISDSKLLDCNNPEIDLNGLRNKEIQKPHLKWLVISVCI
ncbi:hypothetical protein [Alicyclobacillus tolerans]|uniref:hypothetical protein n=1 Tax=Alicyclobacillus tolerans TaxID=90970 RepID=UPI003B980504